MLGVQSFYLRLAATQTLHPGDARIFAGRLIGLDPIGVGAGQQKRGGDAGVCRSQQSAKQSWSAVAQCAAPGGKALGYQRADGK